MGDAEQDDAVAATAAHVAEVDTSAKVVSAARVQSAGALLLKLTVADVASSLHTFRCRCPLWTVTAVDSDVHARTVLNILVPTGVERRRLALERARESGPSRCLRAVALLLFAVAVVAPLVQIAVRGPSDGLDEP